MILPIKRFLSIKKVSCARTRQRLLHFYLISDNSGVGPNALSGAPPPACGVLPPLVLARVTMPKNNFIVSYFATKN